MTGPFWEHTYRDDEASTFGNPSTEIQELASILPHSATVLDMGCGEGRNALFLAERGFSVHAFDISPAGIDKLRRSARSRGLTLNAWVQDMRAFTFDRDYDWVISHGVLHLLARDEWSGIITSMKNHTIPGGVNVVAVFTDLIPPPDDLAPFVSGLFAEGELAALYADWRVELNQSYIHHDHHPNGVSHTHPIDKIVAWRPGGRET